MLAIREFELEECAVNSDNEVVGTCVGSLYVAIYDDNKYDGKHLVKDIDRFIDTGTLKRNDVVIMPAKDWKALKQMICNNYEIKKRRRKDDI